MLGRWSTAVPYNIDNRFQAWVIHWVQGALSGEHAFYDASTFAPASGALTFSDHLIGLALPLMPLRWLGLSPAAIFNTGVLLGGVTSACAGYVLGYVLTQRRAGRRGRRSRLFARTAFVLHDAAHQSGLARRTPPRCRHRVGVGRSIWKSPPLAVAARRPHPSGGFGCHRGMARTGVGLLRVVPARHPCRLHCRPLA